MADRSFTELVDESPDALLALSLSGVVLFWNRGAEAIFGYSAAEAVGQQLDSLIVPPEHRADAQRLLIETIERGATEIETLRRHKNGTLLRVDVSMRKVETANDSPYIAV